MSDKYIFIDLSQAIKNNDSREFEPAKIKYISHKKGAFLLGLSAYLHSKSTLKNIFSIILALSRGKVLSSKNFPDNSGLAWEKVKLSTHTGTHLDAPFHFGKQQKTIEEIPLGHCYNDAVLLDFSGKPAGSLINKEDIQGALNKINYNLRENNIVLIRTGARKLKEEYKYSHCGLNQEAVLWLIEKGVNIIGTDGWSLDIPSKKMLQEYLETKDKNKLWPAHLAGRIKEYWHIEKLDNLDKIPKPYGFKVICFPIKIENASAGWVRVIAIIEK